MSDMTQDFRRSLQQLGVVSYRDRETLWGVAERCARTTGVPMGGAGAVMGIKAGAVTVPGVGAVAGLLAGLVAGTAACTTANVSRRGELRKLLQP